jgi:hypothetical protein
MNIEIALNRERNAENPTNEYSRNRLHPEPRMKARNDEDENDHKKRKKEIFEKAKGKKQFQFLKTLEFVIRLNSRLLFVSCFTGRY